MNSILYRWLLAFTLLTCLIPSHQSDAQVLVRDTLYATASGSPNPSVDPSGGAVVNGDFFIASSGANTITGDGIDEETFWRFIVPQRNDPEMHIVSAVLTLFLIPEDPQADNDNVRMEGCHCAPFDVGSHPLGVPYSIEFQLLGQYAASLLEDSLSTTGGFYMNYQDDAIITGATLELVVETPLAITRPVKHEFLVGGQPDTIRWTKFSGAVKVSFTDDYSPSVASWAEITPSTPANTGFYVWLPPDTIASRACAVSIEDVSNSLTFVESDSFTVKGYILTRLKPDGSYEPFEPTKDGWSFANSSAAPFPLWPPAWWAQFNYSTANDPNTSQPYLNPLFTGPPVSAKTNDFPDWPAYVRVFGRDSCFWPGSNAYRTRAVNNWGGNTGVWNGSCFGVMMTSLWGFHYKTAFLAGHSGVPSFDSLYAISTMNDSIRLAITMAFSEQFGQLKQGHDIGNASTTPRQTLQWIRQMFSNDDPDDDAGLRFRDPANSGGHAVIPYKLSRSTTNAAQFFLYVCNSNNPASFNDYILIDSLANTWQEFTGFGWGVGTSIMYPYPPAKLFLQQQYILYAPGLNEATEAPSALVPGRLTFHVSSGMNITISGESGDSLGFAQGHGFGSMPDAYPIDLETGYPQPPVGYDLPSGSYRIRTGAFVDSLTSVSVSDNSTDFTYSRSDATSQEMDDLRFDGGLHIRNTDPLMKECLLSTLLNEQTMDKAFNVTLGLLQNDSVAIQKDGQDGAKLANGGAAKDYALTLRLSSSAGLVRFEQSSIHIPAHSSHHISPQWDSLATIRILEDIGDDGSIDDTLIVGNLVGVSEYGRLEIPAAFALSQNYPNPFNPTTQIDYALPTASRVRLTVYNLLGQRITTLVDQELQPGNYTMGWNGSDAYGNNVGSGVYFYRLDATPTSGGQHFTRIRKMLLLR